VALFVGRGVHVYLHQANVGVVDVVGYPLGIYQRFGMRICGHIFLLLIILVLNISVDSV
jgi:hypothetical protein